MALNDVYQVNVCQILNGKETNNLFYYVETKATVLPTDAAARDIGEGFYEVIWRFLWKLFVCHKTRLTAIWTARIWPTAGEPWVTPYADENGDLIDDSIPNGSCALISFNKTNPTAGFRRRSYISGVGQSGVFESLLTHTARGNFRLLGIDIVVKLLTTGNDPGAEWQSAAFSKKLAAAADPKPWEVLNDSTVELPIRSQRQRNLQSSVS